jgi:uroporphyrinogen III methyltransferase/synthase|tara:strand:+ start:974 stop:2503 length:1530 start_codon:yes stop_codon:yes gene_type:complete
VKKGKVYLVGAGPGDAGLITVKGVSCLRQADVIIYDCLLDTKLLDSAPPEAERIYAGKTPSYHAKKQAEINQLLVEKAEEGKTVVRLKGGDPFLLGRGGEEAEALVQAHIPFEVVPGISSAIAVPAYAGIPVTHRRLSSSLTIITGHEDASKGRSSVAWEKLATGADTLIFLMGVGNLSQIVRQLLNNGCAPTTPIALIKNGTGPRQETIVDSLADIVVKAESKNFSPPAVIVVGDVVKLKEKLRWFDCKPLFGKRILVTRACTQASSLSQLLSEQGAQPIEMPAIEIKAIPSTEELDQAILNLQSYKWLVFTSANGVEPFFERLYTLNRDARWLKGIKIGVIGPATAKALEVRGLRPDYLPQVYTRQGFLAGLKSQKIAGGRFLLPRADIATRELADGIIRLGAEVHEVIAYKTVPTTEAIYRGKQMLLAGKIDIITFASSSTVTNMLSLINGKQEVLERVTVACIGPATAATAAKAGLKVDIVACDHTIPGLVEAMEFYFQRGRKGD